MAYNHEYELPEPGMTDWHVPLNGNFDRLDCDVEIRDAESNLGQYEPRDGAKFMATDTARVFVCDGDEWTHLPTTGPEPRYASVRARDVNGVAYAKEFPGDGLASKVENALDWQLANTGGDGRVRVTAKDDGEEWVWDKDLTIDPTAWGGITIDVDPNVRIEYPGSGWALTISSDWGAQNNNFGRVSGVTGGHWVATGEATGWLRVQDCYRTLVMPRNVRFQNSSTDAVGVAVENHDGWSESTQIDSSRFYCDICVDFRPAAVTGGSGTSSFHGTIIKNCKFEVKNIGIRARGAVDYSTIDSNSFFVKNQGATLLQLGGSDTEERIFLDGTTVSNNKFEDPGGDTTGDVAIRLAPSFHAFKQPTMLNNKMYLDTNGTHVKDDTPGDAPAQLIQLRICENKVKFEDLTTDTSLDMYFDNGLGEWDVAADTFTPDSYVQYTAQDVTNIPGWKVDEGAVAYHDGSGSRDKGLYYYDGSSWVRQ